MVKVHIHFNRRLDPQEGQRILDRMRTQAALQGGGGVPGAQVLMIDGVRSENPFPQWARDIFERQYRWKWENVNMVYQTTVPDEDAALALIQWFDESFRTWARARGHADVDDILLRAHRLSEDTMAMDGY